MKMRNGLYAGMAAIMMTGFMAGCGGSGSGSASRKDNSNSVAAVIEEKTAETAVETLGPETSSETRMESETFAPPAEGVDVDLTVMSSTMVYGEVYNMMMTPEDYVGEVVKAHGPCAVYTDDETGKSYYTCLIQDATACCAQGIEFVLTDDYTYPDEYPQKGEEITVTGTFDTYYEGEYMYCTLRDAVME